MLTDGAIRAFAEAGDGGPAAFHPPRPEPLASVLPWRILGTAMRNPIAAWPPVLFEGTSWRPPFPARPRSSPIQQRSAPPWSSGPRISATAICGAG